MSTHLRVMGLFLVITLVILGHTLWPGYVLTLDMVWAPNLMAHWSAEGLNNTYPVQWLGHALSLVIPSWLVQKLMLTSLFFLLLYLPWKWLPWIQSNRARVLAALVFAVNPFVYARLLAGHWMHLFGYALLPLLLHSLLRLAEEPNRRTAGMFALTLAGIGFFSVHFLYIALVASAMFLGAHLVRHVLRRERRAVLALARNALGALAVVLVLNLFWLVPAFLRDAPLEARFDTAHFEMFAAAANYPLNIYTNLLALGGFWGEGVAWRFYFWWPQHNVLFLAAFAALIVLVAMGVYRGLKNPATRFNTTLLCILGVFAYITALGAAATPFKGFNLFLYDHVPLWNGLRDSHKLAGILALVYAIYAGLAADALFTRAHKKSALMRAAALTLFFTPAFFGFYFWGGFHNQLAPVWYPASWHEAKQLLDAAPPEEKVLALPWHGYLSLPFVEQRVIANPLPTFFGPERIIASRSVEFGDVADQETDPAYRAIDTLLKTAHTLPPETLAAELARHHISYLLILKNPAIPHANEGLLSWDTDPEKEIPSAVWVQQLPSEKMLETDDIILFRMKTK